MSIEKTETENPLIFAKETGNVEGYFEQIAQGLKENHFALVESEDNQITVIVRRSEMAIGYTSETMKASEVMNYLDQHNPRLSVENLRTPEGKYVNACTNEALSDFSIVPPVFALSKEGVRRDDHYENILNNDLKEVGQFAICENTKGSKNRFAVIVKTGKGKYDFELEFLKGPKKVKKYIQKEGLSEENLVRPPLGEQSEKWGNDKFKFLDPVMAKVEKMEKKAAKKAKKAAKKGKGGVRIDSIDMRGGKTKVKYAKGSKPPSQAEQADKLRSWMKTKGVKFGGKVTLGGKEVDLGKDTPQKKSPGRR